MFQPVLITAEQEFPFVRLTIIRLIFGEDFCESFAKSGMVIYYCD